MCDIVFEKTEGSGGTVNRTSVYAEAVVQRDLKRKYYEKFRRIYKKTSVPDLFFDKVKLCRSSTSLETSL